MQPQPRSMRMVFIVASLNPAISAFKPLGPPPVIEMVYVFGLGPSPAMEMVYILRASSGLGRRPP
eukprot:11184155-Lingulodinium_polyedra.AAC.1